MECFKFFKYIFVLVVVVSNVSGLQRQKMLRDSTVLTTTTHKLAKWPIISVCNLINVRPAVGFHAQVSLALLLTLSNNVNICFYRNLFFFLYLVVFPFFALLCLVFYLRELWICRKIKYNIKLWNKIKKAKCKTKTFIIKGIYFSLSEFG